mgnify:CR=1 FL=1
MLYIVVIFIISLQKYNFILKQTNILNKNVVKIFHIFFRAIIIMLLCHENTP